MMAAGFPGPRGGPGSGLRRSGDVSEKLFGRLSRGD